MFTNETFKAANLYTYPPPPKKNKKTTTTTTTTCFFKTKFYNVILSHTDYNNYNLLGSLLTFSMGAVLLQ
jgi:hypothetical protein